MEKKNSKMQGGFLSTYFIFTVFRGLSCFLCLEEYFCTQKFTSMEWEFTSLPTELRRSRIKMDVLVSPPYQLCLSSQCFSQTCFYFGYFLLHRFPLHVEDRLQLCPLFCHERSIVLQTSSNVLLFWHFVSLDMVWKLNNTLKTYFNRNEAQESSFFKILFSSRKTPIKANTLQL